MKTSIHEKKKPSQNTEQKCDVKPLVYKSIKTKEPVVALRMSGAIRLT